MGYIGIMEKNMETLGPFKGIYIGYIPTIMENQMEKKMENEMENDMETAIIYRVI